MIPKKVKVVTLNLKELPHLQQDLLGVGVLLLPISAHHIHGSSYRKVKEVESYLVSDNRFVPLFSESAEIHAAPGSCDEVHGLPHLSLQLELDQVQVKGLLPVVELQQLVDKCFQKQSMIDMPGF